VVHSELKKFIVQNMQRDPIVYHFYNIEAVLGELPSGHANDEIRAKALAFTKAYHAFYALNKLETSTGHREDFSEEYVMRLKALEESLDAFVDEVDDSPILMGLKLPLQAVSSFVLGTVLGLVGAVIGGLQGFLRGIWELKNPFSVGYECLLAGGIVSAIAGKRLPEHFFHDGQRARLIASVDRLEYIHNGLKTYVHGNGDFHAQVKKRQAESGAKTDIPGIVYSNEELRAHVKETLMKECYPNMNTEEAFQRFLGQHHAMQVCSLKAKFGMKHLGGVIGHHSFIRVAVEEKDLLPIAYGMPHKNPEKFVDQAEEIRVVSGEQLFEIFVTHERLKSIQTFDRGYLIGQYKAAEYDCRSYVNQVLDSAGLPRTKVKRFVDELDNPIGAKCFKPMLINTTFFCQNICAKDTPDLNISLFRREEYKQLEASEEERLGRALEREEQFDLKLKYTGFDHDTRQRAIQEYVASQNIFPQETSPLM